MLYLETEETITVLVNILLPATWFHFWVIASTGSEERMILLNFNTDNLDFSYFNRAELVLVSSSGLVSSPTVFKYYGNLRVYVFLLLSVFLLSICGSS